MTTTDDEPANTLLYVNTAPSQDEVDEAENESPDELPADPNVETENSATTETMQ